VKGNAIKSLPDGHLTVRLADVSPLKAQDFGKFADDFVASGQLTGAPFKANSGLDFFRTGDRLAPTTRARDWGGIAQQWRASPSLGV